MKVRKLLIILILMFLTICLVKTEVRAALHNNEDLTVTTKKESSDGTIAIGISGLELDLGKRYEWTVVKSIPTDTTTWYELIFAETDQVEIMLSPSIPEILDIITESEMANIYIREIGSTENIVERLSVSTVFDLYGGIDIRLEDEREYSLERMYGYSKGYYMLQEITDIDIIQKYLESNRSVDAIVDMLPTTAPASGWIGMTSFSFSTYTYDYNGGLYEEGKLYLLWGQITGAVGTRAVYGYNILDKLEDDLKKPIVSSIEIVTPSEDGTYYTGEEVKISVCFDEFITATEMPTLSIKIGEGQTINLDNGVIDGKNIIYTYNLKEEDKGQISTVDLRNGNVKDASGNGAELSCPIISGTIVMVNTDDGNNSTNTDDGNNSTNTDDGNNSTNTDDKNNNTDLDTTTTTLKELPKTGLSVGIIVGIIIISIVGFIMYKKYNNMKEIK